MSPRTVWTPPASSRCATCCASWPPRERRCSFPVKCCATVAVINHGKLIRVAPVHDLLKATGEFEVKVDGPAEVLAALRLQPWAQQARVEDGIVVTPAPDG